MPQVYHRFLNEDELLKALLQWKVSAYPKVTMIAGERIRPDIDLLEICKESENQYKTIGYECKLMKFDERSKALSWESFYKGIGQALLYLRNGVQRAVLILGFYKNVPDDEFIEDFKTKLSHDRELLQQILGPHLSIGLLLYNGSQPDLILESNSCFFHLDNQARLFFDSLVHRKFKYGKHLFDAK